MIVTSWICLGLPLAAALAITIAGNRLSRRGAGYLATASTAGAFAAAVVTFVLELDKPRNNRVYMSTLWNWLSAGNLHFGLRIIVDPLSVFMMLIVAGVGSLIVAYSIGYMDGDDEERRYFAYMALFVFSMLLLVQAGNLLIMLAGWGLVGLSSYLLIGFWHQRESAVAAAKKAFVVNTIGDATFALALFLLVQQTGTLDTDKLLLFSAHLSPNHWAINLIALGLLGGAVAKSAQLPLHTWLPDAMEGPTPVSALIHAATMVTAGVYLIVRTHVIFELAPKVQDLAAGLGAATLLVAGLIALVQTDIKRVIAYSTMSQVGYMFLAVGIGSYANGMFHLMTHAFFKALLFMAAGIVIHALGGEQDIRKMGGLRALMPWTWGAFLVGGLALVGVPPFAGFFSKDSILATALARGWYGDILWFAGLGGAFLTGLYTFRMIFIVFGGEPSEYVRAHATRPGIHGGTRTVRYFLGIPVAILAVLSVAGGWVQFASVWTPITDWLRPAAEPLFEATGTQEAASSALAVIVGVLGIAAAWNLYGSRSAEVPSLPRVRKVLEHKFYFDELYDALFYRPAVLSARLLSALVEGPLVNGSISGVAAAVRGLGRDTSRLQTGLVRMYALALAGGLAVLIVVFVAIR